MKPKVKSQKPKAKTQKAKGKAPKVVVARPTGFCFGVERAIGLAKSGKKQFGRIATLGELVHNPLVLKELDTQEPHAFCDPAQLRFALDTLLGKALEWVPPHGDVYLASRHHPNGSDGGPSVRVLIRFHDPDGSTASGMGHGLVENSFELLVCEIVIRAQGGSLSVTATDGEETVIVIDLPA